MRSRKTKRKNPSRRRRYRRKGGSACSDVFDRKSSLGSHKALTLKDKMLYSFCKHLGARKSYKEFKFGINDAVRRTISRDMKDWERGVNLPDDQKRTILKTAASTLFGKEKDPKKALVINRALNTVARRQGLDDSFTFNHKTIQG